MSLKDCDLLKSVLKQKSQKNFKLMLYKLEDEQVELLLECFLNLPQTAQTAKEKNLVKKYKKVFKVAAQKVFCLKSAKQFLLKHYSILKRVISTILFTSVCNQIANVMLKNE